MRVLLVDVDSTIPNLALMRISSYHKERGDHVDFIRAEVSYYPHRRRQKTIDTSGYNIAYASAVFHGTIDSVSFIGGAILSFGGTGIDLSVSLPDEIDSCQMDWSLYPGNDTAYGFISRGCNRKCYFCVVPKKEGRTHQVESDIDKIVGSFSKVKFMGNNFLQLTNHKDILRELIQKKIRFQFNQGLDFRLLDSENSDLLRRSKWLGNYLFAFDDWKYRNMVERQLKHIEWMPDWRAKFYVYTSPHMKLSDTINRIQWLRKHKMLSYVMRDLSCWGHPLQDFYTDLAAWANQPQFRTWPFELFAERRYPKNPKRAQTSIRTYNEAKEANQ